MPQGCLIALASADPASESLPSGSDSELKEASDHHHADSTEES